jgi:hypothetical protein
VVEETAKDASNPFRTCCISHHILHTETLVWNPWRPGEKEAQKPKEGSSPFHIQREREREREKHTHTHTQSLVFSPRTSLGVSCYHRSSSTGNLENKLYESTTRKHNRSCSILLRILRLLRVPAGGLCLGFGARGFCTGCFPSYSDFVLSFFSPSCRDKEDSRRALLTRQSLELRREDPELSCITSYSV